MSILPTRVNPRSSTFASNRACREQRVSMLRERLRHAISGGRERHIERHRARGKLLVREHIDLLADPGSPFLELSPLAAWGQYANEVPAARIVTGVVTGIALISATPCMIIANDASVKGGSFFHETVKKVVMVRANARIHLGGPSIVKAVINEEIDGEALGGADTHTHVSGVSDDLVEDEQQAIARLREIVAGANRARDL